MIFIIDDDLIMARCIATACGKHSTKIFSNALDAVNALDDELPSLIFLDILLNGPDGFAFLNEIASYSDSAKIPIVVVSSLNLKNRNLESYGIVEILDKSTMTPHEIKHFVEEYAGAKS